MFRSIKAVIVFYSSSSSFRYTRLYCKTQRSYVRFYHFISFFENTELFVISATIASLYPPKVNLIQLELDYMVKMFCEIHFFSDSFYNMLSAFGYFVRFIIPKPAHALPYLKYVFLVNEEAFFATRNRNSEIAFKVSPALKISAPKLP